MMRPPVFPPVEVSAAGAPDLWTAHVLPSVGQRVALHSTRAPRVEAGRQLEGLDTSPSVVALIGAGLGFVTEAAHERWPNARIAVFEPSPELARHARARTPALYSSDRISLLTGPDYASDRPLWQLLDQGRGPAPAVIVHPVVARLAPEAAAAAEDCARRAIHAAQMNARARQDNAPRYLLHTLRNLAAAVHGVDLTALYGRLAGMPIVVVAAGPSLDRQLPALGEMASRALIIAADTAWRPLTSAGIDPHLVVALDPTEMNGRHLLNVPSRRKPWLLAEMSIDPRVPPVFGKRAGAFRVANHHPWPWASALGLAVPAIRVWGSVITACTDLALSFGGDPIVFAGADLAFTGGQPYCRGTTFEEDWARVAATGWSLRHAWAQVLASRPAAMTPDVNGVETRTAPYLIEFRDWLVARAVEHRDRRFVNTTGAGILAGPHIAQADLQSFADALPPGDLALDDVLDAAWTRPANAPLARALREALHGLERAAAEADEPAAAPFPEWLEFGWPRLTLTEVRAALRSAGRALDEEPSSTPNPRVAAISSPPRRRHAADRVVRMRAWLTGEPGAGEAVPAAAGDALPIAPESSLGRALVRLLSAASPLTTDSAADVAAGALDRTSVPLSYRFAWSPGAMPLVEDLEEALLDTRATDGRALSARPAAPSPFWRRAERPMFDADEDASAMTRAAATPEHADAAVRASVVATVLGLITPPDTPPRRRRLFEAVAHALTDPRQHRTARTDYRLRWRDWTGDVPLRVDALMGALTGTLTPLAGFGPRALEAGDGIGLTVEPFGDRDREAHPEPRLLFLRSDNRFVDPVVLTERGLPSGSACETMDDGHAVFVPRFSRCTLRIDAAGHASAAASWPADVSGEAPWGVDGAVAWNFARSEVFYRTSRNGDVTRATLPFRPSDIAPGSETTYWLADTGLWEWSPARDARKIAEPPTEALANGWLELSGDYLIAHPFDRDPVTNMLLWRRLPHAWRWAIASGRIERVAALWGGQSCRARIRDAWTVRSHPCAGFVTFTHRDGRVVGLACRAPISVAWAGASLIVTTADQDVLLFRDLWHVIQTIG